MKMGYFQDGHEMILGTKAAITWCQADISDTNLSAIDE